MAEEEILKLIECLIGNIIQIGEKAVEKGVIKNKKKFFPI